MQQHGCTTLADLQQRSVEDIAWYWDAVSRDLGWLWSTPYRQVVDTSRGIQWPRWFVDGRTHMAANCVDKHLTGPRRGAVAGISLGRKCARGPLAHSGKGRTGGGAGQAPPPVGGGAQ